VSGVAEDAGNRHAAASRLARWNPFPLSRLRAALAALAGSITILLLFSEQREDAWIAATWIEAEASIVEALPGPPMQRRGTSYTVTLLADLPDGRQVLGTSIRPMFEEFIPRRSAREPAQRIPPRQGDRIVVFVDPDPPARMLPRREMRHDRPFFIVQNLGVVVVATLILYELFRGRLPRLGMRRP